MYWLHIEQEVVYADPITTDKFSTELNALVNWWIINIFEKHLQGESMIVKIGTDSTIHWSITANRLKNLLFDQTKTIVITSDESEIVTTFKQIQTDEIVRPFDIV